MAHFSICGPCHAASPADHDALLHSDHGALYNARAVVTLIDLLIISSSPEQQDQVEACRTERILSTKTDVSVDGGRDPSVSATEGASFCGRGT